MEHVEVIADAGRALVMIVRASHRPQTTTFFTEESANLQVGFVVYPAGGAVAPHVHLPLERTVHGTAEVLVVRSGRCLIDVYSERRSLVATRELVAGDVMVMMAGGHGFRMLEDTVLVEVKQGPYTGLAEKERFTP